mgnify:CR=1 FL=1
MKKAVLLDRLLKVHVARDQNLPAGVGKGKLQRASVN